MSKAPAYGRDRNAGIAAVTQDSRMRVGCGQPALFSADDPCTKAAVLFMEPFGLERTSLIYNNQKATIQDDHSHSMYLVVRDILLSSKALGES